MNVKVYEKSPYTEKIDAYSRVKLFGANAVDSAEIIRYGNVTRIANGGITAGNGRFALQPSFSGGHVITECYTDGSLVLYPTQDNSPLPELLADLNGMADILNNSLYLSRKLHLDCKDPDAADGYWKRCFCDLAQPPTGMPSLDFYNRDMIFDCREDIFIIDGYVTVLEAKFFKTANMPGVMLLYFEPQRSRLATKFSPTEINKKIWITSELGVFLENEEPIFWFQNCGDLEKTDFPLLKPYYSTFIITDFTNDGLRTRNSVAEAQAFKAAAFKHGIPVSIAVAHLENGKNIGNIRGEIYHDSSLKILNNEEFLQKCDEYRVTVDPVLCGNPYEIKFQANKAIDSYLLPFFFERGRLSVFQETANSLSIREPLLSLLDGTKKFVEYPVASIKTLIFCRQGKIYRIKKQLRNQASASLRFYKDAMLLAPGQNAAEEMKELLGEIRPELVMLELSGYSEAQEKLLLAAVDLCLDNGVSVGVFCEEGLVPPALAEMTDKNFIVGESAYNIFNVKEKADKGMTVFHRFNFNGKAVTVGKSNEEELAAAMRK
ncbi:MAG: hypothetical protein PHV82_04660 [Victivallaceae bacterium]|nr:hypothetical protein [Victivallaceae bacterium]